MLVVDKAVGETPLECLERARFDQKISADVSMTYAGRLDPLASGKLLLLVGEECKEKEKYLGLDKGYEVEVRVGVKTDTGDALGLITEVWPMVNTEVGPLAKFCGMFTQAYPAYSSKTIGGRQLHELARSGELPDEMPTKEIEIYSIEEIGKGLAGRGHEKSSKQADLLSGSDIAAQAIGNITKVNGDFRQEEIITGWKKFGREYGAVDFPLIKLRVACTSGTYMRSLAERIGRGAGTVAFAFSIKRTKIGEF